MKQTEENSSFITLPWKLERAPPPFEGYDIKYPESLVRHFLKRFTESGARVFDPFAGLGTTLFVAEEMGRVPYGVEHDGGRMEWVAGQLEHFTHLKRGDAADMLAMGFPKMDFAMTSPPYMPKNHKWNPLYGGDPKHAGYDVYLDRMGFIFGQMKQLMKRHAVFVLQADNLQGRGFTPLVRDLGLCAERHFRLDEEIIVAWKGGRPDYRHTHCLVFRKA
jgi:hypothetical protein